MGNQNQKTAQNGEISLNISHPKFKNAKLVQQSGQKQIQTTMGVDEKQYDRWQKSLNESKLNSPYLLLPKKKDFSRKGLCGDSGTLKLNFDNYSYLLTEQIYNKHGKKTKFQQCQLWYLLFGLISAQQEVKRKTASKVGDIRPHNIFLNADAEIKISTMYSWPRELNNFNKAFDHQTTYLAPEDIVRLEMGMNQQGSNYSSQIFSIGLTVLSAAMLQDFLRLYDIKFYKFDSKAFKDILDEWKSNTVYSEIFTAVVSNLCELKPERRLSDEQLWNWISKYQVYIKNKEDFVIEEAPSKIDQEIQIMRSQFQEEQHIVYQNPPLEYHQTVNHQRFTDKSVVQSYIPPNQHFLPNANFIPKIPISQQNYATRQQSSPQRGISENYHIQQGSDSSQKLVIGDQVIGNIVGRPLQQHQLPPEVRQAIRKEGSLPARYMPAQYAQSAQIGYSGNYSSGQTQLPPQFVGRTINEAYISPRGMARESLNKGSYQNIYEPQSKERIEETVYIQRPQKLQSQQNYYI